MRILIDLCCKLKDNKHRIALVSSISIQMCPKNCIEIIEELHRLIINEKRLRAATYTGLSATGDNFPHAL